MPIPQNLGFHEIPGREMELTRMRDAAYQLTAEIRNRISLTEQRVQDRESFVLGRSDIGRICEDTDDEIKVERSLWRTFSAPDSEQFLEVCPKLVSYSVALFNQRDQQGWGEIDLVGMSHDKLPVPVELKIDTGDNLLKLIVQVAAYGIAVRKLWNISDSHFRRDWMNFVGQNDLPEQLSSINCVCLASAGYWTRSFGTDPNRRTAGQIFNDAWEPLGRLIEAFRENGICMSFASFKMLKALPEVTKGSLVQIPVINGN